MSASWLCAMWPRWKLLTACVVCLLALGRADVVGSLLEGHMANQLPDRRQPLEENFNITRLEELLRSLDCLHVQLQTATEAMENTFVRYLLHQTHCPVQLSVGMPAELAPNRTGQVTRPRHYAVTLAPTTAALEATLRRYGSRAGTLLCIFSHAGPDDADDADVANVMRSDILKWAEHFWRTDGIHKVYYIMPDAASSSSQRLLGLFYNPFIMRPSMASTLAGDLRGHGMLVDMNDAAGNVEHLFENMHGYPLRTYIFNSVYSAVNVDETTRRVTGVSGADAEVGLLLAERLNFTLQLQQPDGKYFGARLSNGSFNGALGRMIRYETDITLTGFFVKDYRTRAVSFSAAVYMDELCCYVRKARRIPQSILPLFAVNVDVWSSFLAAGFVCPLVWLILRLLNLRLRVPGERQNGQMAANVAGQSLRRQWTRIYIDTWVVWVRVNITKYPPFTSERLFVLSLCLVSVIFGAVFESSLATVYIRPLYYRDIQTMAELEAADYSIYIKHAAMKDDLFVGHSSPVYERLDGRLVLLTELAERLIQMMSRVGGFAAVTRASSLVLDDIYYLVTRRIHLVPECPKNYHIAFVLPQAAPYEDVVNRELLLFLQAGLIDHWIAGMKHRARARIHHFPDYVAESSGEAWKVFTLGDLQLAFYALALGGTLAALVFVAERRRLWWGCCGGTTWSRPHWPAGVVKGLRGRQKAGKIVGRQGDVM